MPTTTEDIGGARDENSLCPKTIPRAKGKGDCHRNDVVNEKCGYCRGNGMLEISRAFLIRKILHENENAAAAEQWNNMLLELLRMNTITWY